jgi:hypothetical protein
MSDLKYKQAHELREEILREAGVDPGERFEKYPYKGIRKANLLFVVAKLQPPGEEYDFAEMKLTNIYQLLSQWAGIEHEPNSGQDWTMNRDLLKALHREIYDD